MIRSDLAREQIFLNMDEIDQKITCGSVRVDKELSQKILKPEGTYVTVESDIAVECDVSSFSRLSQAIADQIVRLMGSRGKFLVVGLGNRLLTADALGQYVCDRVLTTPEQGDDKVIYSLCPGVYGTTGIESYDIISGVVEKIKPDAVIAIDSLCAASTSRIGRSFQLSDAGIVPGSGVKNARKALSKATLGVKVLSIGVPTVVFASTITRELGCDCGDNKLADMVVTPKDIDVIVENCAEILADAINIFSQ